MCSVQQYLSSDATLNTHDFSPGPYDSPKETMGDIRSLTTGGIRTHAPYVVAVDPWSRFVLLAYLV